ncbi:MAG: spore coat protein YsxE [Sporolactobacillus sp.]|nr:spore coat protein YsxE [Sporolactobacillus sp.]
MTDPFLMEINRILFHYDLYPRHIEPKGRLVKVETEAGRFALKRTKLTTAQIGGLKIAYTLAGRLVIDAVTPLPSKYGDLVVSDEQSDSYLLPWIDETVEEEDLPERYRRLFLKAGQLHRGTLREEEDAAKLYASAARSASYGKTVWEHFLDRAEHHTYPSPFEQAVLNTAAGYLGPLEQSIMFFSRGPSAEKESGGLRRALCHGRLSPLHLLIAGERAALTNFESCGEDFFIIETTALVEQASVMLEADAALWHELIRLYLSACPLTAAEEAFLRHRLLAPRAPVDLLDHYLRGRSDDEMAFLRRWRYLGRRHTNAVAGIRQFFEAKDKKKAAEQAAEQAAETGG